MISRLPLLRNTLLGFCALAGAHAFAAAAPVEYFQLEKGFLPEVKLPTGGVALPAFATPNPWAFETVYLMSTNAKGQRTWRIENFLPGQASSQGSTMYLFEGAKLALLVDTAQNTPSEMGKNDLKTIVRHLLGHTNSGDVKPNPVDFVVANTHSHGDHTGKNSQMSDRPLYYPELDWPANAPANWVPIKEGGGAGPHGPAIGKIDLGDRVIEVVNIHAHTPGSTGYLDRENEMLATGDALGSGFVWAHFGMISQYAASAHHVVETVAPYQNLTVLPAHFFQNSSADRQYPPMNGRPVDKQYLTDQARVADAILDGTLIAEPYAVGRGIVWGGIDSARVCFALNRITPDGPKAYLAVQMSGFTSNRTRPQLAKIKSNFYLIRGLGEETIYLVKGQTRALLIGSGAGKPGLGELVRRLIGRTPVEVVVLSDDADQMGGLSQLAAKKVYVPKGMTMPAVAGAEMVAIGDGDTIDLGLNQEGRPLLFSVAGLTGHSKVGLTLVDESDRVLFSGHALGMQTPDGGLILNDTLENFSTALAAWRAKTDGKYDLVYTAKNFEWMTAAEFVDQVQDAASRGVKEGDAAMYNSIKPAGLRMVRSTRVDDAAASIVVAGTKAIPGGDAPAVGGRGGRGARGPAPAPAPKR